MDRRTALKQMAVAGAGITMLQACNLGEERLPIALDNLNVTLAQEDLLKNIVGAIIPEGDVPGALSLEADKFVWVMADDCLSAGEQEQFMGGLDGFNSMVQAITGSDFSEMEGSARAVALQSVMESGETEAPSDSDGNPVYVPADVKAFLGRTKYWTMTGYMQSEHIMREVMPYTLVPQFYHGCVEIDPSEPVNINA